MINPQRIVRFLHLKSSSIWLVFGKNKEMAIETIHKKIANLAPIKWGAGSFIQHNFFMISKAPLTELARKNTHPITVG